MQFFKYLFFPIVIFQASLQATPHITEIVNATDQYMWFEYKVPVKLEVVPDRSIMPGSNFTIASVHNNRQYALSRKNNLIQPQSDLSTLVVLWPQTKVLIKNAYIPDAKYTEESGIFIGFGLDITSVNRQSLPFILIRQKNCIVESKYLSDHRNPFKPMSDELVSDDASYTLEAKQSTDEVYVNRDLRLVVPEKAIRVSIKRNSPSIENSKPYASISSFDFDKTIHCFAQGRGKYTKDQFNVTIKFNKIVTDSFYKEFLRLLGIGAKGKIYMALTPAACRAQYGPRTIAFTTWINQSEFQELIDSINEQIKW